MKQLIADGIAILCIALLVTLLVNWHHSYYQSEAILFSGPAGRPVIITTGRGRLYMAAANVPVTNSVPWSCDWRSSPPNDLEDLSEDAAENSSLHIGYHVAPTVAGSMARPSTPTERDAFGFCFIAGKNILGIPHTFYGLVSVPLWAIIPPISAISLMWSKKKLQTRTRRRKGYCRNCGYDLRASVARCPECGSAVSSLK